MAVGALVAITLFSIGWSLWIRRLTWRCRFEVAATLNIALQGVAVVLMSPWCSATLGRWLHGVTGEWNLEDWIGHDCYIVAISAVVYNAIGRLETPQEFQRLFKRDVEAPATLCIPVLLAAFSWGAGAHTYRTDFFRIPTDFWLTAYWLLLCGTLVYLLAYGCRALLILRDDPRSNRIATLYLASSMAGVVACGLKVGALFLPPDWQDSAWTSLPVWIAACCCGTGFALTSGWSWWQKTRWFAERPGWTGLRFTPKPAPKLVIRYEPRADRPAF